MSEARDWKSPRYKRWRLAVYARDRFVCRLCGSRDGLNAHHIKKWACYPSLRFVVANGITLCRVHHLQVYGKEEDYEASFLRLVQPRDTTILIQMILMRHGPQLPL